jgi:hypothetical protein
MSIQSGKKKIAGFLAAIVMALRGGRHRKINSKDLRDADFKTSAQGMGVSFTEKIRDVFRHKWIKKR